ncbi:four helix bundle protein [Galbibacter orientalis]|uniref:S23 ribosomal protein n=1 Tax=Galbibacter orientalis DSM 19592 TaxID=926559 RepID=I3C6G5_9FLAO|nr:four helix bundle protein [Galbibacter orientalis]EIJ39208.1 S23 ribosomal protein [Galbibacter orientalis DSM 19592]
MALSSIDLNCMRDFKKYNIWSLSHEFTLEIYKVTKNFPSEERFQLMSQMQRAAYSIPSNFSEGCGRDSDKDFNRFIQVCLGSAHELEYFILLSKDLNYISEDIFDELTIKINEIKSKLYNLSKKLIA